MCVCEAGLRARVREKEEAKKKKKGLHYLRLGKSVRKMPHRTTYFFPRQFPDRRFDESSKQVLEDHEKKVSPTATSTNTNATTPATTALAPATKIDALEIESDRLTKPWTKPFSVNSKASAVSQLFKSQTKQQQQQQRKKQQQQQQEQHFADFCDWLAEKKAERSTGKSSRYSSCDEDRELLLPPESEPEVQPPESAVVKDRSVDRSFDCQVSLPRLSSGSSYAGSLFSGTTLDGNLSSDVVKDALVVSSTTTTTRQEVVVEEEEEHHDNMGRLAQRTTESYYLQLALAKRLTSLACLDHAEPLLMQVSEPVSSDAEAVSYRLWVRHLSRFFQLHIE